MTTPELCAGSRCLGTLVNLGDITRVRCPYCEQELDTDNGWVPEHPRPKVVRRALTREDLK